jgi:hypothetical protein
MLWRTALASPAQDVINGNKWTLNLRKREKEASQSTRECLSIPASHPKHRRNPRQCNYSTPIRRLNQPLIPCRSDGAEGCFMARCQSIYRGLMSMKTVLRIVVLSVVAFVSSMSDSQAAGPGGCPPWRPCGPGNSFGGNRLLPQGGFGADFRPSCATHDACLASGRSRRECDREFYNSMNCACENSRHPFLCRVRAFRYYAGVRLFGGLYY